MRKPTITAYILITLAFFLVAVGSLFIVGLLSEQYQADNTIGAGEETLDTGKTAIAAKYDEAVKIKEEYRLEKAAFIAEAKDENSIAVEVGDKTKDIFEPNVKITRWDGEVYLSIKGVNETELVDIGTEDVVGGAEPSLDLVDEKIVYDSGLVEYNYYELATSTDQPDGAYEIEVILKEKPKSNVVEFTIETEGLDFFYQPELTAEEIAQGNVRPDNVIGSYAVYASENKVNYVGGKVYGTGKVGHIYRPKVIDSVGKEVWGELNVDTATGILSVTIPQKFLDDAVYPVNVDPTFGYTSQGSSDQALGSLDWDGKAAQKGTSISNTLTQLDSYVKRNSSNSNIQLEIWSNSSTVPGSRLDGSANIAVTSSSYAKLTASVVEPLSGVDYWAVVEGIYGGSGQQTYVAYDSGSGSGATAQLSASWTADTNRYSVYATYLGDNEYFANTGNTTKYFYHADHNDFSVGTDGTWQFWAKSADGSSAWEPIFTKYNGPGGQREWFIGWTGDAEINMILATNGASATARQFNPGTALTSGNWHQFTFVYKNSRVDMFIDGVWQEQEVGYPSTIYNSTAQLQVGADTQEGAYYFTGSLDEVRLWNYALATSTIEENWNCELTDAATTTLMGYWRLDNNATDSSSKAHNLTANNTPTYTNTSLPFTDVCGETPPAAATRRSKFDDVFFFN